MMTSNNLDEMFRTLQDTEPYIADEGFSAAVMVLGAVIAILLFRREPGDAPDPSHAATVAAGSPAGIGELPRSADRAPRSSSSPAQPESARKAS